MHIISVPVCLWEGLYPTPPGRGGTKFFQQVPASIRARTKTEMCVLSPHLPWAFSFVGLPEQSPPFLQE